MPRHRQRARPTAPAPVEEPAPPVELAGIGVRLACVVYDGLLILALNAMVAAILIGIATPADDQARLQATVLPTTFRQTVLFPALVLTTWLFYGYFWRKSGQTLGMQTWRLRVIHPDGRLLGWGDAFGRCAAAMILPACCGMAAYLFYRHPGVFLGSVLFGFAGNYLWARINGSGVAWHDRLSNTVVIRVPPADHGGRGMFSRFYRG